MKAQVSLGVILTAEFLAVIYGYYYGMNVIMAVLLSIFLLVTGFLLYVTLFQTDSEGRLERDKFGFRIISFFTPAVKWADEMYVCPTFWTMVAVMCTFVFILALLGSAGRGMFMMLLSPEARANFLNILFVSSYVLLLLGYVTFAIGVIDGVEKKLHDYDQILQFTCTISMVSFFLFFLLVTTNLLPHSNGYDIRNFDPVLSHWHYYEGYVVASMTAILVFVGMSVFCCILLTTKWFVRGIISMHYGLCPRMPISNSGKESPPPPSTGNSTEIL